MFLRIIVALFKKSYIFINFKLNECIVLTYVAN